MSVTKRTFQRACELPLAQALALGADPSVMVRGLRSIALPRP